MTTFLTTQDVQELLHVDRSTVYRMAEDGRLPAVKVGRQWRFPADRIADQPRLDPNTPATARPAPATPAGDPIDHDAAHSMAELLADLYGVMAVVTDLDGRPLTDVVNPCGFYDAVAELPGAAEMCTDEWRSFAARTQMTPKFTSSHLGFLCARTFVFIDRRPVAMLLIGGVTPADWPPPTEWRHKLADQLGIAPTHFDDLISETYDISLDRQRWMLRTLPQIADLVSLLLTTGVRTGPQLDAVAHLVRSPFTPQTQIGTAS